MMSENPQRTAFTSLDPEWAAYRDQLVAYARAGAEGLSPGDPRALVPESLRPGKHRVHSSYVWLGGLGAAMTVAVLMVVSMFGSVVGALAKAPSSLLVVPFVALGVMVLVVVVFAVVFLVQWLSWKHLSYELLPEEFNLYSGILNKKRRHVPYQRVQSVNQQAGVLQRILGVCDVKIDTAGGASNDAIMLKFVQTSEAEALRSEIFRRKKILLAGGAVDEFGNAFVSGMVVPSAWMMANAAGDERAVRIAFGEDPASVQASAAFAAADARVASTAAQLSGNVLDGADEVLQDIRGVFGGEEVATGSVSYETGLSNKELFFAGLSGAAGHFGVIIAGIIGVASFVAQIFESNIQAWTEDAVEGMIAGTALEGASPDAAASVVGGAFNTFAWEVALWAVLCVIALWAFSVVGSVVQYGGFRVRRRENRIEVEHGLLQRSFHGVDVDRVQTVVIKQSFVRRLIGYCELSVGKIDSLSTEDSNAVQSSSVRGLVIHPFVKVSRVPEILDGVLPEFSHVPEETGASRRCCPSPRHRSSQRHSQRVVLAVRRCGCCLCGIRVHGGFGNGCCGSRAVLYRTNCVFRLLRLLHPDVCFECDRRRFVVQAFGHGTQPRFHEHDERRLVREDLHYSAQENTVWLHQDESVSAYSTCRHSECAYGCGRRRHDGGVVGCFRGGCRRVD